MEHVFSLNVDWLSVYCTCSAQDLTDGVVEVPLDPEAMHKRKGFPRSPSYSYADQDHGTRQYKHLVYVYCDKEKIAEVQYIPCSAVLLPNSCIVKFDNRVLYSPHFQSIVAQFLREHSLTVQRITRLDIAADFTKFYCYECVPFIRDFLNMKLRHIGRGGGQSNFSHGARKDEDSGYSRAWLNYGGLTFGARTSDVRVYLYDKTKELDEVHDKPYIRDSWVNAGIDTSEGKHVWRLEVSITRKGISYRNKDTDQPETITLDRVMDDTQLLTIYNTFVAQYFAFIRNRDGITNVTREPRLQLFAPTMLKISRGYLRCVSGSNRADRILIKKLLHLPDELRAMDTLRDRIDTEDMAYKVAAATDLIEWLKVKQPEWDKIYHKQ